MGNVDPNADLSGYLASLTPDQLLQRYRDFYSSPTLAASQIYGAQDSANAFAYNLAYKTLGRAPAAAEIIAGPGQLTAANVGQILAAQQSAAPPTQTVTPPASSTDVSGTMAPGTSSPGAISMDTSSPGGTTSAFASQYGFGNGPLDYAGSAPNATAAPPSDNSMLWVLAGVAALFFLGVFKHG